jgi:hypothetical protein
MLPVMDRFNRESEARNAWTRKKSPNSSDLRDGKCLIVRDEGRARADP